MLNDIYKLPKTLLAILLIGGGIVFILLNDPPHTFCDTQVEHFKRVQRGILYKNPKDFHTEKSTLKRKKNTCQKENAPGACYEYFAYLRRLLKDLRLLSKKCLPLIYEATEMKEAFSAALSLMTALAWREEILTGKVSKYNWLTRPDLFLFCELKTKYIMNYGKENYNLLEKSIIKLLPVKQKVSPKYIKKKTILSDSCVAYR